ncbi:N-formylglutamate amidohydrolase [Rhodococcus aetherivorans]|uniref:N-formylglutamate amidohydrolase n=1 Tax=Rhodococcus aetherivorans TaxID=191292 RepID=UPI0002D22C43|nr:N-formylglutamate amidohydrolase [Rhodococcus aetherivorans]CCW12009.1 putative N-formylglutamate aminohydrolase [Rhodococcus aetherivorans]
MNTFSILPGHPSSPVILHVAHASRTIHRRSVQRCSSTTLLWAPSSTRPPTGTDLIATLGADYAEVRPWIVCNAYSRLVVDPERFPDDSEPAAAYGRGAVYTRTCTGTLLRQESLTDAAALFDTYFRPYATAVSELVTGRIAAWGRAVIIGVHSYPPRPSGFEDPTLARPVGSRRATVNRVAGT